MLRFIQPTLCMDCKQKQSSKITVKKLCTDFFWIARTLFIFRLLLLKAISSRNTIIPASLVASFNLRRNNAIYLFYVVCFVKKVYIIFSLKQGLIDRENSCHVYYYSRTCHNHHLKSLDKIGCKIGPSRFKQYNLNLVFLSNLFIRLYLHCTGKQFLHGNWFSLSFHAHVCLYA